jgi:hypothetical protein
MTTQLSTVPTSYISQGLAQAAANSKAMLPSLPSLPSIGSVVAGFTSNVVLIGVGIVLAVAALIVSSKQTVVTVASTAAKVAA